MDIASEFFLQVYIRSDAQGLEEIPLPRELNFIKTTLKSSLDSQISLSLNVSYNPLSL